MSRSEDIKILQTGLGKRYSGPSKPLPSKPPTPPPKGATAPLPAYDRAIGNLKSATDRNIEKNKAEQKNVLKEQLRDFALIARDVSSITRVGQERLQRVSIPGGIWVPLSILLALMFVLIPVNGHTRMTWFFLALFQLAHVQTSLASDNQLIYNPSTGVRGAGTQFATGSGPSYSTGIGTQAPQQASTPYTAQYQEGYTPYRPYDDVLL
jgi:hypothetical protein